MFIYTNTHLIYNTKSQIILMAQKMNIPINIVEMKLKTQIENNLLNQINTDLKECVGDLEYIQEKCQYNILKQINSIDKVFPNKIIELNKLIEKISSNQNKNKISKSEHTDIVKKMFTYAYQFYWIFQCFYLKKKDYMGMNLTGLVNGRMETGLSFRNSISKMSFKDFVSKEIGLGPDLSVIFDEPENINNINVYKIKSSKFKWDEEGFEQTYNNIWIITDLDAKEYCIILQII